MQRTELSRGTTLVEMLVALAVASIVLSAVLAVFDRLQRLHLRAGETAEAQRAARAAIERLAGELGLAGLGAHPRGTGSGPDEAIEAALPTAIVFRADLDGESAEARTPEHALSSGAVGAVQVGNDEIVAYALAQRGGSGPDTLRFAADVVPAARDGVVEPVDLSRIDLTQARPPYTLYRLHLHNDPGRYGGGGFVVRSPVIDGVRSLALRYVDGRGAEVDPASIGGDESPAARTARASIRRIDVELVVELPSDPGRSVRLATSVSPRNLARRGGAAR